MEQSRAFVEGLKVRGGNGIAGDISTMCDRHVRIDSPGLAEEIPIDLQDQGRKHDSATVR